MPEGSFQLVVRGRGSKDGSPEVLVAVVDKMCVCRKKKKKRFEGGKEDAHVSPTFINFQRGLFFLSWAGKKSRCWLGQMEEEEEEEESA